MAVSMRLTRMGSKKRPFYRVVVMDSRTKRDGKYIQLVGTYNPLTGERRIDAEIALKWLGTGAKPSATVKDLLSKEGIMKTFHESKVKK